MTPEIRSNKKWLLPQTFKDKTAVALFPHIFVPQFLYDEISAGKPSAFAQSIVAHEARHIERQRESGWPLWFFAYIVSSRFRLSEELVAIEAEMKVLKKAGLEMDLEAKAQALSSWLYFKCVSYFEARHHLRQLWEGI